MQFQSLQATAGQGDEVLLQRYCAERVADRIALQLTIGAIRANHETFAIPVEAGCHPCSCKFSVIKIAKYRLCSG